METMDRLSWVRPVGIVHSERVSYRLLDQRASWDGFMVSSLAFGEYEDDLNVQSQMRKIQNRTSRFIKILRDQKIKCLMQGICDPIIDPRYSTRLLVATVASRLHDWYLLKLYRQDTAKTGSWHGHKC